MTTIQILQEPLPQGRLRYRAIFGRHHATGPTPGAALDALEDDLTADAGTVVILQKFKPDHYLDERQRARLAELMEQLQLSRTQGHDLAPQKMAELEALIEQELRAAARRAKEIGAQITD